MNDIRIYATITYNGKDYPPGIYTIGDFDDEATGDYDLDCDTAVKLLATFPKRVWVIVKVVGSDGDSTGHIAIQ